MPGPAQYQIKEKSYKGSKKDHYSATFISGTKRAEIPVEVELTFLFFRAELFILFEIDENEGYPGTHCIRRTKSIRKSDPYKA